MIATCSAIKSPAVKTAIRVIGQMEELGGFIVPPLSEVHAALPHAVRSYGGILPAPMTYIRRRTDLLQAGDV